MSDLVYMLRRLLPEKLFKALQYVHYYYLSDYAKRSYSQEGEDMILNRLFGKRPFGFYVDVGAYHPKQYSNTYFFYKKGWRGINIDATPGSLKAFRRERPRDINLETAVADCEGTRTFYTFDIKTFNTFDESAARKREQEGGCRIVSTKEIPAIPLRKVFDQYLPQGQPIDFLSVDVEGEELSVLKSNDWEKYRPRVVLCEALDTTVAEAFHTELNAFLSSQGYDLFAKTRNSLIFRSAVSAQEERK